jgi:5-methylcytosine-specific restriction endonuclease McrA
MAKRPKLRRTLRKFVYERDGYACQHCGWKPKEIPQDYRGLAPIRELVGYKRRILWARYSFNGGEDEIHYIDDPVYCALEVDHKVPLDAGGSFDDPDNLQALCSPCNNAKGARVG